MKKTMILTLGCAFFACLTSVGFAQKPDRAQMLDKMFDRLDQNQNGSIDAEEVPEKMKARLDNADANNDGKIEKAELAAMHQQGKGRQGKAAGNRKGQGRPNQGKPGGKPGGGANDRAPQERRNPQDRIKQILTKVDQNQDGKISAEEAPEKMKERFAQIDSNGDQFVDQSELQAMFARIRQVAGGQGRKGEGRKGQGGKGEGGKGQGGKGEGRKGQGGRNPGGEGPAPRRPQRPADA